MSNRNFDASIITRRLRDKSVASNFITSMRNGVSFGNPQTYNANTSIINEVVNGQMTTVYRGDICVTYDVGCPCIIPITSAEIPVIPVVPSGQVLWATSINGGTVEIGKGITSDLFNNIYVIGQYQTNNIRFNSYNDVSSGDIIVSSFGVLSTVSGTNNNDAFIAKYNSSGQTLWATNIGGFGTQAEDGLGITADSFNNVYVTGQYESNTIRFNSYSDVSSSTIIVSSFGTLSTVTGTTNADVFIAKYNSSGQVLWATNIGGGTQIDIGRGITSDSFNNVYVTGQYGSSTIRFNSYSDVSSGIITVSSFGILSTVTGTNNIDAFIAKYNSSGQTLWATNIGGFGTQAEVGVGITIDSFNNVYVTGQYGSSTIRFNSYSDVSSGIITVSSFGILSTVNGINNNDAFIAKYNSSGQVLWVTSIGGITASLTETGRGIISDSLNNIYVIGDYNSNPVRFNSYSDVSSGTILVSSFGTLSTVTGTTGASDAFIAKYNSSGQVLWVTNIGGNIPESGRGITSDALNNIYVTGDYTSNNIRFNSYSTVLSDVITVSSFGILSTVNGTNNTDVFIAKYNSSGQALWATNVGGLGVDIGNGITSDSFNNIYVTGQYTSNPVRFNSYSTVSSGTIVVSSFGTLPSSGSADVFIAKYSG
jgi:hypothetical protein